MECTLSAKSDTDKAENVYDYLTSWDGASWDDVNTRVPGTVVSYMASPMHFVNCGGINAAFMANSQNTSNSYNFYASGDARNYFAGKVGIKVEDPQQALSVDGNITASGTITPSTVVFELERDNSANYISTTNAEGETETVYNGPTIDVKAVCQALIALKSAAAASTDYASLKSAIATALADI